MHRWEHLTLTSKNSVHMCVAHNLCISLCLFKNKKVAEIMLSIILKYQRCKQKYF